MLLFYAVQSMPCNSNTCSSWSNKEAILRLINWSSSQMLCTVVWNYWKPAFYHQGVCLSTWETEEHDWWDTNWWLTTRKRSLYHSIIENLCGMSWLCTLSLWNKSKAKELCFMNLHCVKLNAGFWSSVWYKWLSTGLI